MFNQSGCKIKNHAGTCKRFLLLGVVLQSLTMLAGCAGPLESRSVRVDVGKKSCDVQLKGDGGVISESIKLVVSGAAIDEKTLTPMSPASLSGKFEKYIIGAYCIKTTTNNGWTAFRECSITVDGKDAGAVKF